MLNKRTIPAICEYCGKGFLGFRSSQGRFCSKPCSVKGRTPRAAVRFARVIDLAGPMPAAHPEFGNCWLRIGGLGIDGYARFQDDNGRRVPAHVFAWECASGTPVPDGFIILHTCDVRNCVRNDEAGIYGVGDRDLLRFGHLALGTYQDNLIDASIKGHCAAGANRRAATKPESYRRGEQHHAAVLTMAQAQEIRHRRVNENIPARQLALEFKVSLSVIKNLLRGKTYQAA